jgi:hypothetical protein
VRFGEVEKIMNGAGPAAGIFQIHEKATRDDEEYAWRERERFGFPP